MTQALIARARSFPGQEKQVWDFYRNNQRALAELRAPIYEEKVVDHIIGLVKVEDRKVSKDELLKPIEDEAPMPAATAARRPPKRISLRLELERRGDSPPADSRRLAPFSDGAGRRVTGVCQTTLGKVNSPERKSLCAIRSTTTPTTSCRS